MTLLKGIAASPGIAIGPIHIVDPEEIEVQDGNLAKSAIPKEKERFKTAIRESLEEVRELREKIALETGEEQARILDAQIDILEDPEAQKQTLAVIEKERKPAAFAYRRILTAVAARLDEADSEYYRGRAIDVRDVRRRMLAHLGGIRCTISKGLRSSWPAIFRRARWRSCRATWRWDSPPTSGAAPPTPRSWRAREGSPRWSA
jgi:phosphotransferase system enzyme I (PtsI)